MEHVETFQLSETSRLVVDYDEASWSDCPLDWEPDNLYVAVINQPYRHNSTIERDTVPHNVPIDEIRDYAADDDELVEALGRHFARKGYDMLYRRWRGYSQGDWLDYVIATPSTGDNRARSMARALETWLSGEVYCLTLETLETWHNSRGETRETWEVSDSVCGVYLNDITLENCKEVMGI